MSNKIINFFTYIKRLDKFGKRAILYYEGENKRTSWIGFVFSILYVFIYLAFFIYKLIRLLKKFDVVVYDTFAYIEKPPSINVTNDTFYFGFALEDPVSYDAFINETIYYPKAYFKEGKRVGGKWDWYTEREIELEICKTENFGKSFQDKFKNNSLNSLYCFKYMNDTLHGHFSYDEYSMFFIQLFPCRNSTENNNHCQSRDIIDKYLNGTYFTMQFEDIELTPQEHSNPVRPRNQDIYFTVGKKLFQEVHIFYQIVDIETDEDILGLELEEFKNFRKDEYLKYHSSYYMSNLIEDDIYRPESKESICNITIKLHDQVRIQRRTYSKIVTIWGDIGGFMDFIYIIFNLISSFPIDILYEKEIVIKLFNFDMDNRLIYVKKFPKSKIPIDFQELSKNKNYKSTDYKVENSDNKFINDKDIDDKYKYDKFSDYNSDSNIQIENKKENKGNGIYSSFISADIIKNLEIHLSQRKEDKMINNIKINIFSTFMDYFPCFFSKRYKNINNFLMRKGMEIFIDKMNIFTIFKKSINNEIILNKEQIIETFDIPISMKKILTKK